MPHVAEIPPPAIQNDLDGLDTALDESVPKRTLDENLLIATWNIKAYGGLTEEWVAAPDDSPKRDLQSIRVIAEILRRFDVIAVQEIYGDLKALRHTLKALGDDWGLVLSDATRGPKGRNERLGFLFDRRKIQLSGLAGEVVVPESWIDRTDYPRLVLSLGVRRRGLGWRCRLPASPITLPARKALRDTPHNPTGPWPLLRRRVSTRSVAHRLSRRSHRPVR